MVEAAFIECKNIMMRVFWHLMQLRLGTLNTISSAVGNAVPTSKQQYCAEKLHINKFILSDNLTEYLSYHNFSAFAICIYQ